MITKFKSPDIAHATKKISGDIISLLHSLLEKEAKIFKEKNKVYSTNECCPQCLKAHLIKKAQELSLDEEIDKIHIILNCQIGHDGYYINEEKLMRI